MKTPAGTAGQVRPRRSVSIDAAHRPPAESEAPGMEINISILNLTRVCLQSEIPSFLGIHFRGTVLRYRQTIGYPPNNHTPEVNQNC